MQFSTWIQISTDETGEKITDWGSWEDQEKNCVDNQNQNYDRVKSYVWTEGGI